jgi:hypothetical protein
MTTILEWTEQRAKQQNAHIVTITLQLPGRRTMTSHVLVSNDFDWADAETRAELLPRVLEDAAPGFLDAMNTDDWQK